MCGSSKCSAIADLGGVKAPCSGQRDLIVPRGPGGHRDPDVECVSEESEESHFLNPCVLPHAVCF